MGGIDRSSNKKIHLAAAGIGVAGLGAGLLKAKKLYDNYKVLQEYNARMQDPLKQMLDPNVVSRFYLK